MTSNVIDLATRRPQPDAEVCPCPAHRLEALAKHLQAEAARAGDSLLIDGPELADALHRFADEARGILAATQPQRTKP